MTIPPAAPRFRIANPITGVGAQRSHRCTGISFAASTSATAPANSSDANRVSYPTTIPREVSPASRKYPAVACAHARTFANVNSSAMIARHPSVPNLMEVIRPSLPYRRASALSASAPCPPQRPAITEWPQGNSNHAHILDPQRVRRARHPIRNRKARLSADSPAEPSVAAPPDTPISRAPSHHSSSMQLRAESGGIEPHPPLRRTLTCIKRRRSQTGSLSTRLASPLGAIISGACQRYTMLG